VFYDPPRVVSLDLDLVLEIRGCGEVTVVCGRFASEL